MYNHLPGKVSALTRILYFSTKIILLNLFWMDIIYSSRLSFPVFVLCIYLSEKQLHLALPGILIPDGYNIITQKITFVLLFSYIFKVTY